MAKLTKKQAIEQLQKLAEKWPDDLMLFSASGTLLVVEEGTGRVVDTISGIPNDGGNPDASYADGEVYLIMLMKG